MLIHETEEDSSEEYIIKCLPTKMVTLPIEPNREWKVSRRVIDGEERIVCTGKIKDISLNIKPKKMKQYKNRK